MKNKYFVLWYFFVFSFFLSSSQIVNEGSLKISSSTPVYFGDVYTNQASATHDNDGDLYLQSDFINNGTTISAAGTTFFKSNLDIQNILGSSNSINFHNLVIHLASPNKKGVSIADHFGLTVANTLSMLSGDLRLIGDAQLLQTHSGVNGNPIGSGQILMDQQGIASAFGFNYWSAPVNNEGNYSMNNGLFDGSDSSINPFDPQQVNFTTDASFNGSPAITDGEGNVTTPISVNKYWLYKHYQPTNWIQIDETTSLEPAMGYTMKGTNTGDAEQNYVFKGEPNNGTYQIAVNSGENILIGNPYPSALNASTFINDNLSLLNTIYFWVDGGSVSHYQSNYLGGYAMRNLVTGSPPSVSASLIAGLGNSGSVTSPTQYIDVAQGFFVETTASGNITFNNSQREIRTASSETVNFYRTEEANSIIRIGYEDPEGFHRQLALGFMPNSPADMNYNEGYDSVMIDPRDDEMFFIIENDYDKKYVIQGVGAFDETIEIPLGLIMTEVGSHTIMLDAVENFDSPVYIKDVVTNITYNLSENNYSPAIPIGSYFDRFKLVFQPQTLHINVFKDSNIYVYYLSNNIIINNPEALKIEKITILNELGQLIRLNVNETNENKIVIPFNANDGLYIIKLVSEQNISTYKILKH